MWATILNLRELLDRREKRHAILLLGMTLILGFVESTRVASIVPFVGVLADPELVESNAYLGAVYRGLGFTSTDHFLAFLAVVLVAIFVVTLLMSALIQYATLRFTTGRGYVLSRRLFDGYLARPYEWYLGRNSSDLARNVLSEVGQVVGSALTPAMQVVTQSVIALAMIITIMVVDPLLAIFVSALIGGGYFAVFWITRRYLTRIGGERHHMSGERFRAAAEAFVGNKDLRVLGLEDAFRARFDAAGRRLRSLEIVSNLIGQVPQYAMQALSFSLVLAIVLYQLYVRGGIAQALPIIALYALAGQRLLPALQSVYSAAAKVRYAAPAVEVLHKDIIESRRYADAAVRRGPAARMALREGFVLSAVTYRYPAAEAPALTAISLTIPALSVCGFVGKTGAGKTTIVDVILSLLQPQSGTLAVDNIPITDDNAHNWLATVGYVPQSIFLADATVAANIAFGVEPARIDMAAVERAARIANLHDFVVEELPAKYDTNIGERGVRLSGGQRQRVGIARALYRDPDLIVMDEGTSALDNLTERAVMEAIQNIADRKTIILVAHRLSTVRNCDMIFLLDHGHLVASGTYDELTRNDDRFRAMADAADNA